MDGMTLRNYVADKPSRTHLRCLHLHLGIAISREEKGSDAVLPLRFKDLVVSESD